MSLHCMTTVLYKVHGLSPAEKFLLLIIADHAHDNTGMAYPGIDRLARLSGMHRVSIIRNLQSLEQKGELYIDRNAGPRGTNTYYISSVTGGKYDPITQEELAEAEAAAGKGSCKMQPVASCNPPPANTPETKGNPPSVVAPCNGGLHGATVATQEQDATRTYQNQGIKGGESPAVFPSIEEVLAAAAAYPGNPTRGIPPAIPERWARSHWHIRTHEKKLWSQDWQAFMVSMFESLWQPPLPATPTANGRPPQKRERWKVERELQGVQDQIAEHPRTFVGVPFIPEPKGDAELAALKSKRLELKKELEGL